MATMERTSRIVRCPKCLALLQEPPLGTPLYKCGNCSTVLRAKHASSDGSGARRASTRPQQMNRSTPPIHTDSIESRKLPSKPVPLDPTSRQVNLDDPDEYRNRSGLSRLKAADTGNNSPSSLHRNTFPSGPPPPTYLPRTTNTYADNGSRAEQRLAPRDLSASPSDREKEKEPSPVQWRLEPIVKVKDATTESASAGYKPLETVRSTESASAGYKPVETLRSTESASAGYKPLETVRTTESASAGYKPMETVRRTESATAGFKPLETLRSTESTSVGYKLLETVRSTESGMAFYKPLETVRSTESATSGHKSLETGRSTESGIAVYKPLEAVRRLPVPLSGGEAASAAETNAGSQRGSLPTGVDTISKSNTRYEVSVGGKVERAADSDGEDGGRPSSSQNSHPPDVSLRSEPSSNDKPLQDMLGSKVSKIEVEDCDSLKIDEDAAKTVRARMNQVQEVRAMPDKADRYSDETLRFPNARYLQQGLPPGGDVPLVRTRSPELKSLHKEQIVVSKDEDDEDQPGTLLDKREHTSLMSPPVKLDSFSLMSPPAIRKPLSPPRFLQSKSVIGVPKPQPDNVLKVPAGARQDSGAPSNLQEFHGQPDVLDYDTSEDSSNVDDSEQYQITSKPHSEELRSPNHVRNGRMSEADAGDGNSGRSVDEDEHEPTGSQDNTGVINSVGSVKAGPSPFRSPESNHSESPPETQTSNQRKHEVQGRQPPAMESTNSFAFGRGGQVEGPPYSSLKGQTQKIRLQINTPVPDRIHVRCKHCNLQLEVPSNLGRSETGVQKLRCGSCWRISRFRLNHLLDPSGTSSPAGSDRSPETSFRLGSSDGQSSRYSGTRSNRETGTQDRVVIRTQSGANLPVPPSARHNPRAASGSKLSNMVSGSNIPSETSKTSTPNTSGDLGPAGSSPHGGKEMMVAISPTGQAEPSHTSLSPTLSSTSQDVSSKDHRRKTTASPDRKLLQSSSDSEEEKNTIQLKLGPSSLSNPTRTIAWANPTTPEFDDGHEFKGLKGFLKKSVKELTKGKKSTQYRRKVVVNGQPVPDDVVRRAEDYAGGIHPGSYWYDYRAGFWGVMGGPCLGMIPPFIEELNFPLARHCSHGKTGVLVNGRELHHKDLELLKKRGLPGTPGKAYNVDIDGRLTEETTGAELKGLGRLAPTLEQTGRGPGMWVPENQRGS